jgi:hypothetical protein
LRTGLEGIVSKWLSAPTPVGPNRKPSDEERCGARRFDRWPVDVAVPAFGPRMVCTGCFIVGADARPNWKEQPPRESLTEVQWRS